MTDNVEQLSIDAMIESHMWGEAIKYFQKHPEEARKLLPCRGWTRLHSLCAVGSTPTALIELVASLYPEAITMACSRYGDTPIHMVCRNSVKSSKKVKALLKHCPGGGRECILIRNNFGGTPLHSATNHNAVLDVLKLLVETNPKILRVTTLEGIHAVSSLYHAYIQTIPGYMCMARLVAGELVEENHFSRFWQKAVFLSTEYFKLSGDCPATDGHEDYVLHGLIRCSVDINLLKVALRRNPAHALVEDVNHNLPLHILLKNRPYRLKEKEAIVALLEAAPEATSHQSKDEHGNFEVPLTIAIRNKMRWETGIKNLVETNPKMLSWRDPETGLYPFQLAASVGGKVAVDTTFNLLISQPDLLSRR